MTKKRKPTFAEVARDIKEIKIQGARNIAGWALYAYLLKPTKSSIKKLKNLRPTEPMLTNVLDRLDKGKNHNKVLDHFEEAQKEINKNVLEIIEDGDIIFTHCHSTNVIKSLIYANKKGKKFEVYNTETRPLFQGRKTAKELRAAGIKVNMFVDSALGVALSGEQGTKKVSKVFLGADALLKKGVVNKVGSEVIAQVAKNQKIPVYIIADSWKYSPKDLKLEKRDFDEVWEKMPKKSKIKIQNPAFEFVPKKYIKKIVTEFGVMNYCRFLRNVKRV
jgi:ribose 1,5-bisphosphate isomerase